MAFYIDFDYSKGKWFLFPEEPELQLKLRFLSPMKFVSLRTEHTDQGGKVNEEALGNAVLDYVIMDWKGFFLGEGKNVKAAPLNKENLEKVNRIDPRILVWVIKMISDRRNFDSEEQEETLRKNSKSSSDL